MRPTRTLELHDLLAGPRSDEVVVEEPLEIRLNGESVAVTMRTPGSDAELALGFLVTEGVIRDLSAFANAVHTDHAHNVMDVLTHPDAPGVESPAPRKVQAYAACGLCGKTTLDAVAVRTRSLAEDATRVDAALLLTLPEKLRAHQILFDATGALHAAGLFSAKGELLCAREDVGRHNAVDKIVGWAAMQARLPLTGCILVLSGRCGFELVQKALVAGIPIVAAISGPSSLAIDLARAQGVTLASFVRGPSMRLCSAVERIVQ